MLGHVLHDERVSQIRLVAAIFAQRLGERNPLPAFGNRFTFGEILEHSRDHGLHRGEHIVLCDKAHLDVELVELARQPVGARIFVPETGRDLKISIEAGHHQ